MNIQNVVPKCDTRVLLQKKITTTMCINLYLANILYKCLLLLLPLQVFWWDVSNGFAYLKVDVFSLSAL